MNITKEQIRDWLLNNFGQRHFGCVTDEDLAREFADCFNDLAPKWVSDNSIPCGSKWVHRNGNEYEVVTISNSKTMSERYPVTVIYKNVNNGTIWSRTLSDWHRSMKPLPEPPK